MPVHELPPNRLKELMEASHPEVTGVQLAEELDRDPGTISRWVNNKSPIPTKPLYALAERFGVTTDWLLGRERKT